ncbi:MAG TPA: hypothetical protein VFQ45_03580 [Longimicrobium sp.]|nr:hypothetical protein [Longimicrobium sp.]
MVERGAGQGTVQVHAEVYRALVERVELLQGLLNAAVQIAAGHTVPHAQVREELLAAYG